MEQLPRPPPRPDLANRDSVWHQVKVLDDAHWVVIDNYSHGHPVSRRVIDKRRSCRHPRRERRIAIPGTPKGPPWICLLTLLWPVLWVLLHQL